LALSILLASGQIREAIKGRGQDREGDEVRKDCEKGPFGATKQAALGSFQKPAQAFGVSRLAYPVKS